MEMDNKALVLDMLEWIDAKPRTHAEVMDAWRTSCPRLQIWEDATDLRLLAQERLTQSETMMRVTPWGREFLDAERPRRRRTPLEDLTPGV